MTLSNFFPRSLVIFRKKVFDLKSHYYVKFSGGKDPTSLFGRLLHFVEAISDMQLNFILISFPEHYVTSTT